MKQEPNSAEEQDWASKDEPQEIEQAVALALAGAPINTSNGLEHRVQSLPLHPRAERGSGRRFASLTACASRLVQKKWKKRKVRSSPTWEESEEQREDVGRKSVGACLCPIDYRGEASRRETSRGEPRHHGRTMAARAAKYITVHQKP